MISILSVEIAQGLCDPVDNGVTENLSQNSGPDGPVADNKATSQNNTSFLFHLGTVGGCKGEKLQR